MSRYDRSAASRTAADYETFIARLLTEKDHDEIDEIAADPLIDHAPGRRSKRDASRVLAILDSIETGRARA